MTNRLIEGRNIAVIPGEFLREWSWDQELIWSVNTRIQQEVQMETQSQSGVTRAVFSLIAAFAFMNAACLRLAADAAATGPLSILRTGGFRQ